MATKRKGTGSGFWATCDRCGRRVQASLIPATAGKGTLCHTRGEGVSGSYKGKAIPDGGCAKVLDQARVEQPHKLATHDDDWKGHYTYGGKYSVGKAISTKRTKATPKGKATTKGTGKATTRKATTKKISRPKAKSA